MKGKKCLLLAAAVLYGVAAFFCLSTKEKAGRTYLLLTEPIGASRGEEIFTREALLEDPMGFCFWGDRGTRWVSCRETGGVGEVNQVVLSGNPGLLDAGALTWQEGCFLDESTARALFGTADCREQILRQESLPYRVIQTLPAARPTMLTAASDSHGEVLNRCVLDVPAESGQQEARQFLLRWGLAGDIVDYDSLWTAVYDLLLLAPMALILGFLLRRRKLWKGRRALLLLSCVCLLVFLGSRLRFPPDMLPSRWSDFSFWGNWWAAQQENFRLVLRTPMGEGPLQMMMDMVKSVVCTTGACILSLFAALLP